MTTPTALDALKYVALTGIDTLDFVIDRLGWMEMDDDDPNIEAMRSMLSSLEDTFHEALQSQVPHRLAALPGGATTGVPHSNTYEQARFYSNGTPVYYDEPCTVPMAGEDGVTHLVQSERRVFTKFPGGDAA